MRRQEVLEAAATIIHEDVVDAPHTFTAKATPFYQQSSFRFAKSIDDRENDHRSDVELASSINFGHGLKRKVTFSNTTRNGSLHNANASRFSLMSYVRRKTTALSRKETDATYLSSSLDIGDPRKRHINLGIMSRAEHRAVYVYNHISVTWRKAIGLVLAIVWAATVLSALQIGISER